MPRSRLRGSASGIQSVVRVLRRFGGMSEAAEGREVSREEEMESGVERLIPHLELAIEMARVHGKPMIYIVGQHETGGQGVANFEASRSLPM